ncbi:MAG TPA: hypothetical protein VK797_22630 [Tepidisphaeraceae bacterium]|nr:hypothetical protein [Tepidisphaeraceae bacterium]
MAITIDYGGMSCGQTGYAGVWVDLCDGTTAASCPSWQPIGTQTQILYDKYKPQFINPYATSNAMTVTIGGNECEQWLRQNMHLWYRNFYTGNWTQTWTQITAPQKTPGERLREIIRARQAPLHLPSHRKLLLPTDDARELRARASFRRIVGEHNWRSYCARGYVSVRGKSGRVYQIFAGHDVTRVYEGGRLIERLCIVLSGHYPPTDSILMRYVMVLSDEAGFCKQANRTVCHGENPAVVSEREVKNDLLTEWQRIKGRAA